MPQNSFLKQKSADLHQVQLSVANSYTTHKTVWDNLDNAYPLTTYTCEKCTCNLTGRVQIIQ